MSPAARTLASIILPYPITGVRDEDLAEALDAYLADEFSSPSHHHIHSHDEEHLDV